MNKNEVTIIDINKGFSLTNVTATTIICLILCVLPINYSQSQEKTINNIIKSKNEYQIWKTYTRTEDGLKVEIWVKGSDKTPFTSVCIKNISKQGVELSKGDLNRFGALSEAYRKILQLPQDAMFINKDSNPKRKKLAEWAATALARDSIVEAAYQFSFNKVIQADSFTDIIGESARTISSAGETSHDIAELLKIASKEAQEGNNKDVRNILNTFRNIIISKTNWEHTEDRMYLMVDKDKTPKWLNSLGDTLDKLGEITNMANEGISLIDFISNIIAKAAIAEARLHIIEKAFLEVKDDVWKKAFEKAKNHIFSINNNLFVTLKETIEYAIIHKELNSLKLTEKFLSNLKGKNKTTLRSKIRGIWLGIFKTEIQIIRMAMLLPLDSYLLQYENAILADLGKTDPDKINVITEVIEVQEIRSSLLVYALTLKILGEESLLKGMTSPLGLFGEIAFLNWKAAQNSLKESEKEIVNAAKETLSWQNPWYGLKESDLKIEKCNL